MVEQGDSRGRLTRGVRRVARVWSIASVGLVVAFLIGEGFHPTQLAPAQRLGFLCFPVGVCLGMVLAWWKEGLGGGVTVASLAAFYAIHVATAGALPKGLAWPAFAAPGFLFVLCWYRERRTGPAAG